MSGKVFIQRDYSGGTRCQFQSKFPPELENRVRWGRARSEPSGTPVPAARLASPRLALSCRGRWRSQLALCAAGTASSSPLGGGAVGRAGPRVRPPGRWV